MTNVLFVCIHNSARSQMAEAFLNQACPQVFTAYSAGLEPGVLNPLVVEAMQEVGLDLSGNQTKSVDDMLRRGRSFSHVVTVCDDASAERCPVFPGAVDRLHWSFPRSVGTNRDPGGAHGGCAQDPGRDQTPGSAVVRPRVRRAAKGLTGRRDP